LEKINRYTVVQKRTNEKSKQQNSRKKKHVVFRESKIDRPDATSGLCTSHSKYPLTRFRIS